MKHQIFLIIFLSNILIANAQSDFEKFQLQQNQGFDNYSQEEMKREKDYIAEQDSLFIQYKDQIEKEWNEFKESSITEWVTYTKDFKGRSQVDFEEGEIKIAAVVEKNIAKSEEKAKEIVKKMIIKIMSEKDDSGSIILSEQIEDPISTETIDNDKVNEIVEKIITTGEKTSVIGKDEKKRDKFEVSLKMVPNHIKIRSEKYQPIIEKFCKKYNVEPKVVFAIIHTESFFNPKAYNRHGNAYGMMQIVPKYAGRTMNNVIFNRNSNPTSDQLFTAEINLEMGIGYIRWLADNKWNKIKNETNLYYCIICSYNGGPGTIYKAMTGKMRKIPQKDWDKMISDLNSMDSDKLYEHLKVKVPFKETRHYIKLVRDRMEKFYNSL